MHTTYKRENKLNWFIINISSKPERLIIIFIVIILIGILLSTYTSFITAFPRSGAILIVLAITSVYLNHYIISDINNINNFDANLKDISSSDLKKSNPAMSDKEAEITVLQLHEFRNDIKQQIPKLQVSKRNIIHLEFLSGIIGTLIWGFGDLFFS